MGKPSNISFFTYESMDYCLQVCRGYLTHRGFKVRVFNEKTGNLIMKRGGGLFKANMYYYITVVPNDNGGNTVDIELRENKKPIYDLDKKEYKKLVFTAERIETLLFKESVYVHKSAI